MVPISEKPSMSPEQAAASLETWHEVKERLDKVKVQEIMLRKSIFGFYFPSPVEGTNRADIGFGYDLKGVHKINRTVDEVELNNRQNDLRKAKIDTSTLIKWEPSLVIGEYNALTQEQKTLVDFCLAEKVGTPSLEIVPCTSREVLPLADAVAEVQASNGKAPPPPVATTGELILSKYKMTDKADGVEFQDYLDAGWSLDMLLDHGYLVDVSAAPAPRKRRGRPAKAQ